MKRTNPIKDRRREAEWTLPVRLTIGVPPYGFGQSLNDMTEWLSSTADENRYAWVSAGLRGGDATHLYLPDLELARAFATRWPVLGLNGTHMRAMADEEGAGKK